MKLILMLLAILAPIVLSKPLREHFTAKDVLRAKSVLENSQRLSDSCSLYYSVIGLQALEQTISDSAKLCSTLKEFKLGDAESTFCAMSASKKLGCPLSLSAQQIADLKAGLQDKTSVAKLYHSYGTLAVAEKLTDVKVADVVSSLKEAMRTDEASNSYGYAFLLAAQFPVAEATTFLESVEDAVALADEIDGTFLQYEAGLYTTAVTVEGALALAAKVGKAPPGLDSKKIILFSNYLVSRRSTTILKAAGRLASALVAINKNNFFRPLSISITPDALALTDAQPKLKVAIFDIMGKSAGSSLTVTIISGTHAKSGNSIMDNKPMKAVDNVYEYAVIGGSPAPASGLYKVIVKVTSTDTKLAGISEPITLETRVMAPITVTSAEVGVVDSDAPPSSIKLTSVQLSKTSNLALEADYHQKVMLRFQLKDGRLNTPISVHQAFVRFENVQTGREIVFIAEPSSNDLVYKFEMAIAAKSKEFGGVSGSYRMFLILGDAAMAAPQMAQISTIKLHFAGEVTPPKRHPDEVVYTAKPEIHHMFRQPEKRPLEVVSLAFTALVLAPLLLMVIVWTKLGCNVSALNLDLSTLVFHTGLAGIFGLYICFFIGLNMFKTLLYLVPIGVVTFIFGHRVLSGIAARKQ